jgi:hypothetical protein
VFDLLYRPHRIPHKANALSIVVFIVSRAILHYQQYRCRDDPIVHLIWFPFIPYFMLQD